MSPIQLRSPENVLGMKIEPCPDWTFDGLFSELKELDSKFNSFSLFNKDSSRDALCEMKSKKGFVMGADGDNIEWDEGGVEESVDRGLGTANRFGCLDLFVSDSDDSEDEFVQEFKGPLMEKTRVVEDACPILLYEFQLGIQEGIRNQISSLEAGLQVVKEKSTCGLTHVEENSEERRRMDRKHDMEHQRMIAEALDEHLTAIQRDHEQRSRLEQKRIRDDAAREEARRKEKAMQEEKLLQEKAKAAEEARLEAARKAEDAIKIALEAERKALADAAEKTVKENSTQPAASVKEVYGNHDDPASGVQATRSNVPASDTPGGSVRAAESALKMEEKRWHKYKELHEKNLTLMSSSNMDFVSYERRISRVTRLILGSVENVRAKANELLKILTDPVCPQSVSMVMIAKKIISSYEDPDAPASSAFARGHVVGLVSGQVPQFIDILVAEFNRVCIYTVPKHVLYSKSAFREKDAYAKAMGYREEDGKIEDTGRYLGRLEACMKLYAAVVQTQVNGVQNLHGLEEGWAWLARFLNYLPADGNTAVALAAFLSTAGFALHRKYKSQFRKLLHVIHQHFLVQLKKQEEDPKVSIKVRELQEYIESKKYLEEPEGWRLQGSLLSSHSLAPQAEYQPQYHSPNRRYFY